MKVLVISILVGLLVGCSNPVEEGESAPPAGTSATIDLPTAQASFNELTSEHDFPGFEVCDLGVLSGEWIRDDISGLSGLINGLWFDSSGDTLGHVNGSFSLWEESYPILTGSVTGYVTDEIIGELYGVFYYDDYRLCPLCGSGHGGFYALFLPANGVGVGILEAEFGDYSLPPEDNHLPMSGNWTKYCDPELARE